MLLNYWCWNTWYKSSFIDWVQVELHSKEAVTDPPKAQCIVRKMPKEKNSLWVYISWRKLCTMLQQKPKIFWLQLKGRWKDLSKGSWRRVYLEIQLLIGRRMHLRRPGSDEVLAYEQGSGKSKIRWIPIENKHWKCIGREWKMYWNHPCAAFYIIDKLRIV